MKTEIFCEVCGNGFLRENGEINRNKKLARPVYCSLKCAGKANLGNIPKDKRVHPENITPGKECDEFSPFRFHIKCMKNHSGKRYRKPCHVTVQDLKEQWDRQNGICPYTGWKLKNACSTSEQLEKTPDRASVDRIDSSKPYTKDNIQFVSLMAQFAKNGWGEKELIEFGKAIVGQWIIKTAKETVQT